MPKRPEISKLTVRLDSKKHRALRMLAVRTGMTITAIVNRAIDVEIRKSNSERDENAGGKD